MLADPGAAVSILESVEHGTAPSDRGPRSDLLAWKAAALIGSGRSAEVAEIGAALQRARPTPGTLTDVAHLLLRVGAGEHPAVPLLVPVNGCERPGCGHRAIVELALAGMIGMVDRNRRVTMARTLHEVASAEEAFVLLLAREMTADGQGDAAVELLRSHPSPRATVAAGVILYHQGRYAEAMQTLPAEHPVHAATRLGAALLGGPRPGSLSALRDVPLVRALIAEAEGRHLDAAGHWRDAGRSEEATQAALAGGLPIDPAMAAARWWRWRTFALTGRASPVDPPQDEIEQAYAEIGDARSALAAVVSGEPWGPSGSDAFRMSGIVAFARLIREDPAAAVSRLGPLPNDGSPATWARAAMGEGVPGGGPGLIGADVTSWIESLERAPIPGITPDPGRLVARSIRIGPGPSIEEVTSLAPGPARIVAMAVALGRSEDPLGPLAGLCEEALGPDQLGKGVPEAAHELTVLAAATVRHRRLPVALRARAGEVAGALLAQTAARHDVSAEAGRRAASIVKASMDDVQAPASSLSAVAAFALTREDLEALRAAGAPSSIPPMIALLTGHTRIPAGAGKAGIAGAYGTYARAVLLARSGDLAAAELAVKSHRSGALPDPLGGLLAQWHIERGDASLALTYLGRSKHPSAAVVEQVMRGVAALPDEEGPRVIGTIEELPEEVQDLPSVRRELARRLGRRRFSRGTSRTDLESDLADLKRAASLDPRSAWINEALGDTHVMLATVTVDSFPSAAIRHLWEAHRVAPHAKSVRENATDIARTIAQEAIGVRDMPLAISALEVIVRIDPSDHGARQALMRLKP